ncbi:hypothetical protein TNCV_602461 [Trichonephila clavipes]|nr:hypothetical protein TNCV_602461 [Trichonephila clavipes]
MSDMKTGPADGTLRHIKPLSPNQMTSPWQITNEWPFELCNALESTATAVTRLQPQECDRKTAQGND